MRLENFLFGYREFKISGDPAVAMTRFLRLGISCEISSDGSFVSPLYKCKKYRRALLGIEYTEGGAKGLSAVIHKYCARPGILSALLLSCLAFVFSSLFVWDVRVTSDSELSSAYVEEQLSGVGFGIGSSWRKIQLNKVELDLLASSDRIGWVNINRRGTVAYVSVRSKSEQEREDNFETYSNIVASRDCVIESITVKSGVASVEPGDVVKAGELLISGVLPDELGGGFVRAEGTVYAKVYDSVSLEVQKVETVFVPKSERLVRADVKIFNFSINIFKSYRKSDIDCDIIEDTKEFVFLGKARLPIKLCRTYKVESQMRKVEYGSAQLVSLAMSRLDSLRASYIGDSEILRINTEGTFTDTGYLLVSRMTLLASVGEERSFLVIGRSL